MGLGKGGKKRKGKGKRKEKKEKGKQKEISLGRVALAQTALLGLRFQLIAQKFEHRRSVSKSFKNYVFVTLEFLGSNFGVLH